MVRRLAAMLPDADELLELEPEELAGYILRRFVEFPERPGPHLYNFVNGLDQIDPVYPNNKKDAVKEAIGEAWSWLMAQGLFASKGNEWLFVTRKGRLVGSTEAFADFLRAAALPRASLHPRIAEHAWRTFLRSNFDTAVFEAFKEVEIAVRSAGNFDQRQIGTALMRAAFDKNTGPLRDPGATEGEREALAHLFSGAIGSYKNPHSHRRVGILDAAEAGELLMLASHLLRIVDDRAS